MSVDITRCLTDKNVNVVHNSSTDTKGYYDCHSEQRSLQTQFKLVTCWRAQGCSKCMAVPAEADARLRKKKNKKFYFAKLKTGPGGKQNAMDMLDLLYIYYFPGVCKTAKMAANSS